MRRLVLLGTAIGGMMLLAACGGAGGPQQSAKPAAPAYPAEVETAATKIFGNDARVISYGDLAKNGKQQALIVTRVKITPETMVPGLLITRAAIIEKEDDSWSEVFLCDEHLKNPKGFLGGQPVSAVDGWRLQTETSAKDGLEMYFTPLAKPAGGYIETYEVRWNPKVKRYETLDRNFQHFLKELSTLEPIDTELH